MRGHRRGRPARRVGSSSTRPLPSPTGFSCCSASRFFVATSFFLVGVLLAIWTVLLSVVWPLAKGLHFVLFSQTLVHHRARAVFATGIGLAGVAALLFVLAVGRTGRSPSASCVFPSRRR